jgi:hypothetical protein
MRTPFFNWLQRGSDASIRARRGVGARDSRSRGTGRVGGQSTLRQQRLHDHALGRRADREREGGLGDEAQINVVLTATALCINGGGDHPKAVNKESVSAEGTFPVQNGKAEWTLSVTATFSPSCTPPMTVAFTDVTVTDTTNGLRKTFPGTF